MTNASAAVRQDATHPTLNMFDVVHGYLRDGWQPFPLPARKKTPPPSGYTGAGGLDIKGADAQNWLDEGAYANLGIRMPDGVLGIDVDGYGGKHGVATVEAWEAEHGTLPPAPYSTNRPGTKSTIRFFRVPKRIRFDGVLSGGDVEIIQHVHRYAVAWPSIHPEGRPYLWFNEADEPLDGPPEVEDLPDLPAAWVEALNKGPESDYARPADVTSADVRAWLDALPGEAPCAYLIRVLEEAVATINSGSRHDAAKRFIGKVTLAGDQGHHGASAALDLLHTAWLKAFESDGSRKPNRAEWESLVSHTVGLRVAEPVADADKGCCGALSKKALRAPGLTAVPDDISALTEGDVEPTPTLLKVLEHWHTSEKHEVLQERFDLPDGNHLKVGPLLGLYRTEFVKNPIEGEPPIPKDVEITKWIAVRTESHQRYLPDERARPIPSGAPSYAVAVYTRDRKVYRSRPGQNLSAEQSTSGAKVLNETDAPVAIPTASSDQTHVNNMLRQAGRDGSRTDHREFGAMGWYEIDGQAVHTAPLGSVDANGSRHDIVVGAPGDGDRMSNAMRATGWSETLSGSRLQEGFGAVRRFIAIAPERPEIGVATLGAAFASYLHLSRRAAIATVGEKDSGKSLVNGRLQTFWADIDPRADKWAIYLPKSTVAGSEACASWHRDTGLTADDYRLTNSRDKNVVQTAILTALAQGSYGTDGAMKSNASSGVSAQGAQEGVAFISAETLPPDEAAAVSRMVVLSVSDADIPKGAATDGTPSALDSFRTDYSLTGLARGLMATYVQRLASKANDLGGVAALRRWADDKSKAHFAEVKSKRAGETVAVIMTGWEVFNDLMGPDAPEGALLTEEELKAAYDLLLDANVEAHREAAPGARIKSTIQGLFASNEMHAMDWDKGPVPDQFRSQVGWVYRPSDRGDYAVTHRTAGFFTVKGDQVLITQETMLWVVERARLTLNKDQIVAALAEYVVGGSSPGARASSSTGIIGRPRGFLFKASELGLPSLPADDPARRRLGEAKS